LDSELCWAGDFHVEGDGQSIVVYDSLSVQDVMKGGDESILQSLF